jgi:hypothetical protein
LTPILPTASQSSDTQALAEVVNSYSLPEYMVVVCRSDAKQPNQNSLLRARLAGKDDRSSKWIYECSSDPHQPSPVFNEYEYYYAYRNIIEVFARKSGGLLAIASSVPGVWLLK